MSNESERQAVKKSLIIIASALLLAVGAASHHRLRYDSTVFAGSGDVSGGPRAVRVEYPPCVKGVREDRCIQLYERGVRRSYQRWLAAHGRGGERVAARGPGRARAYPACRGRKDDRCQQRSARRHARVVRPARAVRHARVQPAHRVAVRAAPHRRAASARPAPQRAPVVRQIRRTTTTTTTTRTTTTIQRQRPGPAQPRRGDPPVGTPGI